MSLLLLFMEALKSRLGRGGAGRCRPGQSCRGINDIDGNGDGDGDGDDGDDDDDENKSEMY